MAGQNTFQLKVYNQSGAIFEGDAAILFVPGKRDEVAILPEHTPLIMLLHAGQVSVVAGGERKQITRMEHGILYVGQNEVSVLINA